MSEFAGEEQGKTVEVIRMLRQGYGVEDMQAMGVCHAGYARMVIQRLREMDILRQAIMSGRKK